jgi:hypothetical protein
VVVLPNIGVKIPFEVEEFKGFVVKGYWLLVKYENTEGFVFDGFLSRLPAPNKVDSKKFEDYLDFQIGKVGDKFDFKIKDTKADTLMLVKPNDKYEDYSVEGQSDYKLESGSFKYHFCI